MSSTASLSPSMQLSTSAEIATRAREIWLQDGCPDEHAVKHWLKAEALLRSEREFSSRQNELRRRAERGAAWK